MASHLGIYEIERLFTEDECRALVQQLKSSPTLKAERNGADYQRSVFHDEVLTRRVQERVRRYIPPFHYVSDRFRFSHYKPGGEFSLHQDGIYQDPRNGHRSTTTISVFLNDDFTGGETEFFSGSSLKSTQSVYVGKPQTGKAIVFPREVYHRGNLVEKGEKFLLRTDLMSTGDA